MLRIESAKWKDVRSRWEEIRTYDLMNPIPTVKINLDAVWVNLDDVLQFEAEKTFVFLNDFDVLGCLRIQDFSSFLSRPLRLKEIEVAGIGNVAVTHEFRGNGIGEKLMAVAHMYLDAIGYDLSLLYSSAYTKKIGFYEKLGYHQHGEVLIRDYAETGLLTPKELDDAIERIGKF